MSRVPIEGLGCSNHGCVWGHDGGMGTNGPCQCILDLDIGSRSDLRRAERGVRWYKQEIERLQEVVKAKNKAMRGLDEVAQRLRARLEPAIEPGSEEVDELIRIENGIINEGRANPRLSGLITRLRGEE